MRISDWSSDVCSSDLRAFPLRPDYHIVWLVSAAILLTYATLTALWYLTGWQQAPGALLIGSVSIAFFGGADDAGAALAQSARFSAIDALDHALLHSYLFPPPGGSCSLLLLPGVFMYPPL